MRVFLQTLIISNFKGIKKFQFDPFGKNIDVLGANETGKSTLFDAYLWLLFGRDSLDQAEFDIKERRDDASEVHNIDHSVEAVFVFEIDRDNREEVRLKKTYKEIWTKKRGSTQKTFTGHTNKYWIDEGPVTQTEYNNRLAKLIDPEVFRLVSDPLFFARMDWQKQRDLFMKVFGDVQDEDLVQADPRLVGVLEVLGKLSTDQKKKALKDTIREINQELKEIPARIDELEKQKKPDVSIDKLSGDLVDVRAEISGKETDLQALKTGVGTGDIEQRIRDQERVLKAIDNDHTEERLKTLSYARQKVIDLKAQVNDYNRTMGDLETSLADSESYLKECQEAQDDLLKKWREIFSSKPDLDHDVETVCFNCLQALPPDQLEKSREKALAHFEAEKHKTLEKIETSGKNFERKIEKEGEKIQSTKTGIESLKTEIVRAEMALEGAEEALAEAQALPETPPDEKRQPVLEALADLKKELDDAQAGKPNLDPIMEEIRGLKAQEEDILNSISEQKNNLALDDRIKYLSNQEKNLAQKYEDAERDLDLINNLVVARSNALTAKINKAFEITKFQLFEDQINEGVRETFIILKDGVPYRTMNGAGKILCGVDIINVLSKHLNYFAPIWIDNAESITNYKVTPREAQFFRLFASPDDEKIKTITK